MFSVFMVLLFILVIAVAVVLIVALPQLRSGNEIFTEDGKQAVARAGQVARTGPIAVVGGTKNLITGTSQKLRPVSETLHAQFDRLEERDARSGVPVAAGKRSPSSASDDEVHRAGSSAPAIVGPRGVPVDSGPIPEVPPAEPAAAEASGTGPRDVVPPRPDVVIDLRDPSPETAPIATTPIATTPIATGKVAADRPSADPA